ncbi:hypothetical protein OO184_15240 [Photorhabdus sp. APURE]|uniref:hypothetical protein n=1 Tax=Photorhabdus aballayi TaxID=2991723 RepID=UPI00223D089C|nr:hypothetical protein [Photorhabdus aballayi]MCW7549249.1 hypothetical protein [Photorhabdus aballayi]
MYTNNYSKEKCPSCRVGSLISQEDEYGIITVMNCNHCSWHFCCENNCPLCIKCADDIAYKNLGIKDRTDAFYKMAALRKELCSMSKLTPCVITRRFRVKQLDRIFMDYIQLIGTSYSNGAMYQIMLEYIYSQYIELSLQFDPHSFM